MLSSTQQFIDALEAKGIKYEINEPTQSGKDVMTVTYSGDRMPTIRCLFFFDEDCESVAIRVFDILKVPKELYDAKVKDIYIRAITDTFGDVPYAVVNDGDVSALAGAMSLEDNNVLGIAMGTSEAVGYVDEEGNITGTSDALPVQYCGYSCN